LLERPVLEKLFPVDLLDALVLAPLVEVGYVELFGREGRGVGRGGLERGLAVFAVAVGAGAWVDLFVGKDGLMNDDGAVSLAGLANTLDLMAANAALPNGVRPTPEQILLPREFGGLYR